LQFTLGFTDVIAKKTDPPQAFLLYLLVYREAEGLLGFLRLA